jgi:hypothetical protein
MLKELNDLKNQYDLMCFARTLYEEFPYWHAHEVYFLLECLEFHQKIEATKNKRERNALVKKFNEFVFDHCEATATREAYNEAFKKRLEVARQKDAEEKSVIPL